MSGEVGIAFVPSSVEARIRNLITGKNALNTKIVRHQKQRQYDGLYGYERVLQILNRRFPKQQEKTKSDCHPNQIS